MSDPIIDFLQARISNDAADAVSRGPCDCAVEGLPLEHGLICPVRLVAECEAKCRILADAEQAEFCEKDAYSAVILVLAAVYADHPDYRESWRP